MALNFFLGGAATTPKKYTYVLSGTPTPSGTTTVTINGKSVTLAAAASGETTDTLASKILAALQDPGVPGEFKVVNWSKPGVSTVQGVGQNDGRPLTVSAFTVAGATVTASSNTSSSAADLSLAANWSLGTLPTASDTAVLDRNVPIRYGLDALAAVACQWRRTKNHRSDVGLPDVHLAGFAEYLPTMLQAKGTDWDLEDTGTGTVRIVGSITATYNVNVTGSAVGEPRIEVAQATGFVATWACSVVGGGLKVSSGAISSLRAVNASVRAPNLIVGGTQTYEASNAELACTGLTLTATKGSSIVALADAAGVALSATDSVIGWRSTGGTGPIALGTNGTIDASLAPGTFTLGDVTAAKGATVRIPGGVPLGGGFVVTPSGCTPADLTLDVGQTTTVTFA
jgi:hypothetical protein